MESMTGMELLAHLCARSPQTRVIFITGHEDAAAEATVKSAGAFAFFIKPFDEGSMLERGASCARPFHSFTKSFRNRWKMKMQPSSSPEKAHSAGILTYDQSLIDADSVSFNDGVL